MITPDEFNALRLDSILSGTFTIGKDANGKKWAVIGNIVIDIVTLKLLLLWKMSTRNTSFMWRNASKHPIIDSIKTLNPELAELDTNYKIVSRLHYKFSELTKEQSARDLINRYEQFVDND